MIVETLNRLILDTVEDSVSTLCDRKKKLKMNVS